VRRVWCVPEISQDRNTARLELRRLRVLVLVDHVLVETLRHQLTGLWLHPGGDERRQIEPRAAIEQQLVMNQLVGDVRRHGVVGERRPRRADAFAECRISQAEKRIGVTGG
jgi:hypothetical protein